MLKLSKIIANYNKLESQDQKQQFLNRLIYLIENNFLFLDAYEFYIASLSVNENILVSYSNEKLKCSITIEFNQKSNINIVNIKVLKIKDKKYFNTTTITTTKNFQKTLYKTRDTLKELLKNFLNKE